GGDGRLYLTWLHARQTEDSCDRRIAFQPTTQQVRRLHLDVIVVVGQLLGTTDPRFGARTIAFECKGSHGRRHALEATAKAGRLPSKSRSTRSPPNHSGA